jgi:hypothetical protein
MGVEAETVVIDLAGKNIWTQRLRSGFTLRVGRMCVCVCVCVSRGATHMDYSLLIVRPVYGTLVIYQYVYE